MKTNYLIDVDRRHFVFGAIAAIAFALSVALHPVLARMDAHFIQMMGDLQVLVWIVSHAPTPSSFVSFGFFLSIFHQLTDRYTLRVPFLRVLLNIPYLGGKWYGWADIWQFDVPGESGKPNVSKQEFDIVVNHRLWTLRFQFVNRASGGARPHTAVSDFCRIQNSEDRMSIQILYNWPEGHGHTRLTLAEGLCPAGAEGTTFNSRPHKASVWWRRVH